MHDTNQQYCIVPEYPGVCEGTDQCAMCAPGNMSMEIGDAAVLSVLSRHVSVYGGTSDRRR